MKTAAVAELKASLSRYLRRVKAGEEILVTDALRAADAFQLAAALLWSRGRTTDRDFVALDDRVRDAAAREGFRIVPA